MADKHGSGLRYLALLVVLLWPAVSAADFLNPSFEGTIQNVTPYPDTFPQYWRLRNTDHTLFGSQVTNAWKTDGVYAAGLYSRLRKTFAVGDSQSLWQSVDLTGMSGVMFDVRLASYGNSAFPTFMNFEAQVLVDNAVLWTQTVDGAYLNQQVDVSGMSGTHTVELRIRAVVDGPSQAANWVQWDNMRLVKMPEEKIIDAKVTVVPRVIVRKGGGKWFKWEDRWVTCFIELPEGYSVKDIDSTTVTLEGVSAHVGKDRWAKAESNFWNTRDWDWDRAKERMVKFDREAVEAALTTTGKVTVTVTGKLPNHVKFVGTDTIRVFEKCGHKHGGRCSDNCIRRFALDKWDDKCGDEGGKKCDGKK